jgi:hypothetical protein
VVGHDADSTVLALVFPDVVRHLFRQVHLGFTRNTAACRQ